MARKKYEDDIILNGVVWTMGALASIGAAALIGTACQGIPMKAMPKIIKIAVPYGIGGLAGMAGEGSKKYVRHAGMRALKFGDVIGDAVQAKIEEKRRPEKDKGDEGK